MPVGLKKGFSPWGIHGAALAILAVLLTCLEPSAASVQTGAQPTGIEEAARAERLTIVHDDPAGLARVQRIVDRIFRVADDKEGLLPPPIAIVNGNPPNAQADGRYLFVTQSLLKLLPDDNELAIVLGHELAHHIRGHSRGPSLEGGISSAARRLGFRGDLSNLTYAATQVQEEEADRYGLLYAALAGYDVSAAPDVFDKVLVSDEDPKHPPKAERERIFRGRLQSILDAVDTFNVGVDYALRDQFNYAENAFQELLQNDFRTHDIYHNLGTIHHLIAFRKYLLPKDSPANICSVSLELTSSFELQGLRRSVATRGTGSASASDKQQFLAELERVIEFYQQALRVKPDSAPTLSNLGCAYLHRQEEGDLDQGLGTLKRAAKLEPKNAVVANNLAVAYLLHGNKERALAELRRALELNPDFAHAHYNLGMVLEGEGTPEAKDEARRAFQSYLKDTEGVRTAYYVAQARQQLGLNDEENPSPVNAAIPAGAGRSAPPLPVLPGDPISHLPTDAQPERKVDVSPEDEIQLWRFSGWQLLVQSDSVDQVTVESNRYRTLEGIRLGSTVEEVRKAYGIPDGEQSRGELKLLCYVRRGYLFRARNGRIYSWSVFRNR